MEPHYKHISRSLVARHPQPVGVIEFYGGQFFGQLPVTSYDYLLATLFRNGYTIIGVPFTFGFDHVAIAEGLLRERDNVRRLLPELDSVPHFWLGHSLGCKFISLLEVYTNPNDGMFAPPGGPRLAAAQRGILDEPAILMAPDIADTAQAVPIPALGRFLDALGLGIQPDRRETQHLIESDPLFGLTALISFHSDRIAGNISQSPERSDAAWFLKMLQGRHPEGVLHQELPGGHLVPLGLQLDDIVLELDPFGVAQAQPPALLEQTVLEMLGKLNYRRVTAVAKRAA
ncbi:MAG: DUF1350 family protein [Oscillochloris sp.]|nr:DUF1350 family protein [Oscillochloris sp.]